MSRSIRLALAALAFAVLARPVLAQEGTPAPISPPPAEQAEATPSAESFMAMVMANMGAGDNPEMGFGAMAPPPDMEAHVMGGGPLAALTGANALTDDQYDKLYALKESCEDQMGPMMLQLHQAQRHLHAALTASDLDMKNIKSLESQVASARAAMSTAMMDKMVAGAQILTPAQRLAIHKHMERMALGGWHHGWGGHPMMHHGPHPMMMEHHHPPMDGHPPEHKE